MAKRRRNRKRTISQLRQELEDFEERDFVLMGRALGHWSDRQMTKRNRKRAKDARNHWSREWEEE